MKTVRSTPKPQPSRSIKRFAQPAPAPAPAKHTPPAANEVAAETVRKAMHPGSIDPRQMIE